jgi:hypothetical protein
VEQAFDHRFKLYSTGEFFDLQADVDETSPHRVSDLSGEASAAAGRLQGVLDQFKDARPAHLDPPRAPGKKNKAEKGPH